MLEASGAQKLKGTGEVLISSHIYYVVEFHQI